MGDYTQVPNPPADSVATASASAVPSVPVSNPPADPIAPDPNRPVSTIPADSLQTSAPVQPPSADPVDQVFEASASAEVIPPADSETTASGSIDSPPPVPQTPQSPELPQSSDVPAQVVPPAQAEPQSPPVSIPVESPKESSIQDPIPSNQPSQVQPEAPKDTSIVQGENTPPQSAGIKPEPLEVPQNTPPADSKPPESPKTSFGDLSATVQPVPSASPPVVIRPPQSISPPTPQPQPIPPPVEIPPPVSSFGDLMEKPADLSEEPTIHIDPIEVPPIAPAAPPITAPTQPTEENQQAALALRRQHATEARKQKREENLTKVIEFVQKKGR